MALAWPNYYIPLSSVVGSLGLNRFPYVGDKVADALAFAIQHPTSARA